MTLAAPRGGYSHFRLKLRLLPVAEVVTPRYVSSASGATVGVKRAKPEFPRKFKNQPFDFRQNLIDT